jgi:transcriptional regulator with PAS, ATPase and Fis domain
LKRTLATGQPIINKVVYIVNAKGAKIPVSISTAALKDDQGNILGGVESFRDLRAVDEIHRQVQEQNQFAGIIGRSPVMRKIFDLLPAVAQGQSTVLIEGESGTGKELVARAIHNISKQRSKKLVALNCGALQIHCWNPSCLAIKREPLPMRVKISPAVWLWLRTVPFFG